jgi:hypothetical protein
VVTDAQLLNLALTKKSKQANDFEIMCGFPLSSVDSYVEKLVRQQRLCMLPDRSFLPHCLLDAIRSCTTVSKSPSATRSRCVHLGEIFN